MSNLLATVGPFNLLFIHLLQCDQSTTEEGCLVLQKTSESERHLSSISSDQPLPPITPTELTTKQFISDIMRNKDKKIKLDHPLYY